jgi:hypothetical protein
MSIDGPVPPYRTELVALVREVTIRLAEHGVVARRALAMRPTPPALLAEVRAKGEALDIECRRLADRMERRGHGDLAADLRRIVDRRPRIASNDV